MTSSSPRCPVCASCQSVPFASARDVEYYTSDKPFTYRACTECHSVFLQDPPVDQLHIIYPANYYSYQRVPQGHSVVERVKEYLDRQLFRKLLEQIRGDDLRVLDVGGGRGGYSR